MCRVSVYEAKTNLSKYIDMLETGKEKEIVIMRYGKEVAVLNLYDQKKKKKRLGAAIGILEPKEFNLKDPDFEEIYKGMGY